MSPASKRRRLGRVLAWVGSAGALVLLGLYLVGAFEDRIPAGPPRDVEVSRGDANVFEVAAVRQVVYERAPGTVRPIREATVTSRLVAEVRAVLVRPSASVQAGDPLVLLDDRDMRAALAQREESLAGARALLEEAEATYARTEAAAERDAVSRTALEKAEATRLAARAEVERLAQAVEAARVDLSHATLRAPFDAVITDRYVQPGDLATPQRPLLDLYDPSQLRLEAYVRESLAIHLAEGQPVTVELDTLGRDLEGIVEEVLPQADPISRSFLVKVGLPASDGLHPGMFGRLRLAAGEAERLLVPARALLHVGQLTYVTLATPPHGRRLVVPGSYAGPDGIEIQSGVEAGLRILVPR